MIRLSRLNHLDFYINDDLIETIESTPDTMLCLTSGKKIIVSENPEEVVDRIVEFRRRCLNGGPERLLQEGE